jgi:serine/threonine-protein kinase HipA
MVMDVITVKYRNQDVGALSYDTKTKYGVFEYEPKFLRSGLELSPLKMPLSPSLYSFPDLDRAAFKGLPGMLADSLPDDFGNAVLNAWIAGQGKSISDITPLQRLQYTGTRGMGALTFHPATQVQKYNKQTQIAIESLVDIAQRIVSDRENFSATLNHTRTDEREAMLSLLSVGMSAGGARPKAVVAFNDDFTQVRSGQIDAPAGFTHYLLKFDGVTEHRKNEQTFGDPLGFGAMEYVYSIMAKQCGITMMPCRLLHEGNRRHFITQRFDRVGNQRIHVQTLNGLAHVSYKQPGSFSYAELFATARALKLTKTEAEQLLRRMVFNIVARNHDDHSKNFGFLMSDTGQWSLAPAYDIAYSYKPGSEWVNSHWMSLNNKRDGFTMADFYSLEPVSPLFTRERINKVVQETIEVVSTWEELAKEHDVPKSLIAEVQSNLRLKFAK